MAKVVIIGNGISGITAARHIRKQSDLEIDVISSETDHFFSRTALMYIYMGHMKFEHTKPYEDWFWKKNNINLIRNRINQINTEDKKLHCEDGKEINYDYLILAVGSKSNKFGWPGQELEGVQGLYNFQDLEQMESHSNRISKAVIVGGGLIGIEMAEMFLSRKIDVTFLVREENFWDIVLPKEEAQMIDRHILKHHVDLKLSTELQEIRPDDQGRVGSVVTNKGEFIECQFVGLTVGVSPNIDFLKDSSIETDRGILVDEYLRTNIPNVYALGDCAQFKNPLPNRRPIEQVWYTGRMMGETVAQTICGKETVYEPGNWFNSAKFLDLEYQTYGYVWPRLKKEEETFYWEKTKENISFRVVFHSKTRHVLGFNVLGMRLRHEICDQWLSQHVKVDYVINNLQKANFDPEFFKHYEGDIQKAFNNQFPEMKVSVRQKGFLEKILR